MTTSNCNAEWCHMRVSGPNGTYVLTKIDMQDYERVSMWKWMLSGASKGYVRRTKLVSHKPRKYTTLYLHRFITGCPDGMEVDHVNGDPLDNRRSNLRIVSRRENLQNVSVAKGRSGIRGVERLQSGRFSARATVHGKRHYIGTYDTPQEAGVAASEWRQKHMPFSVEKSAQEARRGRGGSKVQPN